MEEPSPAGVAVLAFYYETQRNGLVTDMESQCKTHCLTPFREVWLTACRCLQRLAALRRHIQYSIFRHIVQVMFCVMCLFYLK